MSTANLLGWWYGGNGSRVEPTITTSGDGQPVTAWADKSTSALNLTKAGAGTATYRKSVIGVGRGAVEFSNSYFSRNIAAGILANLNSYSLFIVFSSSATALSALYGEGNSTTNTPVVTAWLNNPANTVQHFHRDDASVGAPPAGGTPNDGNLHILTVRRISAGSWSVRLDGVEVATSSGSPGTTTVNRLAIGALIRTTVSAVLTGLIYCTALYSGDNYRLIEAPLGSHYGKSIPAPSGTEDLPFSYSSSIDSITNLQGIVTFPYSGSNLPILVAMHSFSNNVASTFPSETRLRLANQGLFCVFPEMRGRGTSGGSADGSGREIQDIVDAVDYVKANFPAYVDSTQVYIVGYSGGGGNVLAAVSKFPDYWNGAINCFGIADYGEDATNGWYNNGSSAPQKALMETWIGGTPAAVPNNYSARNAVNAITNFTGGLLRIYHDQQDSIVPIINSQRITAAMDSAGLTNYNANYTNTGDSPRWTHGEPDNGTGIAQSESLWVPGLVAKTLSAWTIPSSGTLKVAGYLDTKRFRMMLGTGIEEFGQVIYDMSARTFTITATTGAATFSLKLKGQIPNSSISATINGAGDTQTSDASGNVTFTGTI